KDLPNGCRPCPGGPSMLRTLALATGALGVILLFGSSSQAQTPPTTLNRYYYFPYTYYPHNYWPTMGPKWPEPVGAPYMRPPGYMAYPPFKEAHWRYELWEPQHYYRGFHFLLDQF